MKFLSHMFKLFSISIPLFLIKHWAAFPEKRITASTEAISFYDCELILLKLLEKETQLKTAKMQKPKNGFVLASK